MTAVRFTRLPDRGVVSVSGPDAARLLQDLVTNDLDRLESEPAIHAALLTPQGKILFAFFIARRQSDESFLLETTAAAAPDLARRLTFYRLRAKAEIADVSAAWAVLATWPAEPPEPARAPSLTWRDPRHVDLGTRVLLPAGDADATAARWVAAGALAATPDDYRAHRIACGVAEFGVDFAGTEVFPHEANLDRQAGVDFRKGCFVGQEVVARMQHKTVVRKRFVAVEAQDALPADRPEIAAGPATLGHLASVAGRQGLALVRLDRTIEQRAAGLEPMAGSLTLTIDDEALDAYRRSAEQRAADKSP